MNLNPRLIIKLIITIILILLLSGFLSNPVKNFYPYGDSIPFLYLIKSIIIGCDLGEFCQSGIPNPINLSSFPITNYIFLYYLKFLTLFSSSPFEIFYYFHFYALLLNFLTAFTVIYAISGNVNNSLALSCFFCFFNYFQRITGHHEYFFNVPVYMGCYLIVWLFLNEIIKFKPFLKDKVLPVLFIIIISLSGIYYLFFTILLIGFWILLFFFGNFEKKFEIIKKAIVTILIILIIFFVSTYVIYPEIFFNPHLNLPKRTIFDQPHAALRIADSIIEYGRNKWNAGFPISLNGTNQHILFRNNTEGWDAWSGPIITFFILIAPFYLFSQINLTNNKNYVSEQKKILLFSAISIVFIFLYSTPYGYGYIFNAFVNAAIRSQNRISPFMNFFGLIFFYYAVYLFLAKFEKLKYFFSIIIIVFFANSFHRFKYWESYVNSIENDEQRKELLLSTENSINVINNENRTNKKINILQLPQAEFPEVPNIEKFEPYQHFIFPLLSNNNNLRWSYGSLNGTANHVLNKYIFNNDSFKDNMELAACSFYDFIVVEKRGYPYDMVKSFLNEYNRIWNLIYEDEFRLILKKNDDFACNNYVKKININFNNNTNKNLLFGKWYDPEDWGIWTASKKNKIIVPIYNLIADNNCLNIDLELKTAKTSNNEVNFEIRVGELKKNLKSGPNQTSIINIQTNELFKDYIEISIKSDNKPLRASSLDRRKITFGLIKADIKNSCT